MVARMGKKTADHSVCKLAARWAVYWAARSVGTMVQSSVEC
jgi:hypothetical protein